MRGARRALMGSSQENTMSRLNAAYMEIVDALVAAHLSQAQDGEESVLQDAQARNTHQYPLEWYRQVYHDLLNTESY